MARPVDLTKKIEELRSALQKYNGIPSQTVDRAVHANIKYYLKHHSDAPEIRALIDEFKLDDQKEKTAAIHFESRIREIKEILEEYNSIPKNNKEYQKVYYFFKNYKDVPEVKKLMYIYSQSDCYEYVTGKPLWRNIRGSRRTICDDQSAFKYVIFVFKHYNELPASNTPPMKQVMKAMGSFRYNYHNMTTYNPALYSFLSEMVDLGCNNERIVSCWNKATNY
jgi:hypothetical protein